MFKRRLKQIESRGEDTRLMCWRIEGRVTALEKERSDKLECIDELIERLSEDIKNDIKSTDLRVKGEIAKKTRALAELIKSSTRI